MVLGLIAGAGCAGVKPTQTGSGTGGSGASSGKGGSGSGNHSFDGGSVDLPTTITMTCGNGMIDPGEACDDHNMIGGDGCSKICQKESGWSCPNVGQACVRNAICGDGVLTAPEACDDGNQNGNDGCSADCKSVDSGWQCRVPGKPCVPLCGDGKVTGNEQCDDGNTDPKDGCSATCQLEPGASCTGMPSKCTVASCGNGVQETGEACDCGNDATKLPSGCTGPNGLFNGDGSGCTKTCTKEPTCRDSSGKTGACTTSCGNGNIETGEDCDDGNNKDNDGCSHDCKVEAGFTCTSMPQSDAVPCTQTGNTGNCLELPVKYRDFKAENLTGGHPDFFFLGATWSSTDPRYQAISGVQGQTGSLSFNRRYCVPNSSGPARQNDSTARSWDMAQANLDANGKPVFNTKRTGCGNNPIMADCQFTDFSHDTNGGNVPGYNTAPPGQTACKDYSPTCGLTYVSGANGHPMYKGCAPVVTSADTFGQWWTDGTWESDGTTTGKHAIGTLELAPTTLGGQNGYYQFASAQNSVYGGFFPLDPPANKFPLYYTQADLNMTNTMTGLVNQGSPNGPGTVFTMPAAWSEQLLCDLWPYWYSPYKGGPSMFGGGANCKGNQYLFPPSVSFMTNPNGNWISNMQGWYHDSWFSTEARYLFVFNGQFDLQFYGDDDTFVFINGILVIDLGGVHQRLPGKVHVDATGMATTQEGGEVYLPGETLPAGANVGDLIPCDASTAAVDPVTKVAFNKVGTGNCLTGETNCDCRVRKNLNLGLQTGKTYEIAIFQRDGHPSESNFQLTLSGFSTNQSQCGARCGDGVTTGAEQCDCGDGTGTMPAGCSGPNADGVYNGCTTKCQYGPFCGDSNVDESSGEACDDGKDNGVTYSATCGKGCASNCQFAHCCGDTNVDTDQGEECDLGSANGTKGASCDANCKLVIILDNGL